MLKWIKTYPLTLLIAGVILYLSFFTPPKTSLDEIPNIDKVVHVCMYGGLCLVLWLEYLLSHKKNFYLRNALWGTVVFPVIFSGLIELGQEYLTIHRSGDWGDLGANSIGVLLAFVFGYWGLKPRITGKFNKRK